jgi:hypothetical protein
MMIEPSKGATRGHVRWWTNATNQSTTEDAMERMNPLLALSGKELQWVRQQAGWSRPRLAYYLGRQGHFDGDPCQASAIKRIEAGNAVPPVFVSRVRELIGPELFDDLLRIAREAPAQSNGTNCHGVGPDSGTSIPNATRFQTCARPTARSIVRERLARAESARAESEGIGSPHVSRPNAASSTMVRSVAGGSGTTTTRPITKRRKQWKSTRILWTTTTRNLSSIPTRIRWGRMYSSAIVDVVWGDVMHLQSPRTLVGRLCHTEALKPYVGKSMPRRMLCCIETNTPMENTALMEMIRLCGQHATKRFYGPPRRYVHFMP